MKFHVIRRYTGKCQAGARGLVICPTQALLSMSCAAGWLAGHVKLAGHAGPALTGGAVILTAHSLAAACLAVMRRMHCGLHSTRAHSAIFIAGYPCQACSRREVCESLPCRRVALAVPGQPALAGPPFSPVLPAAQPLHASTLCVCT